MLCTVAVIGSGDNGPETETICIIAVLLTQGEAASSTLFFHLVSESQLLHCCCCFFIFIYQAYLCAQPGLADYALGKVQRVPLLGFSHYF